MARKCVCQLCKKIGDTDTFYRVVNESGKAKYYCNKEEYAAFIQQKEQRYNLLKFIAEEVLEYEDGQIVPPVIVKYISKLNEFYPFEVIHECFIVNQNDIKYWIKAKNFSSEFGMGSYIMKIIENTINDTYKKWKFNKRQEQIQENHTIDIGMMNETTNRSTIKKENKGIMQFLDEDDL